MPAKAPEEAEVAIVTMPKGKAAAAAAKCKPLSAYFGTKRKSPDDKKKAGRPKKKGRGVCKSISAPAAASRESEIILLSHHRSLRFNALSRRGREKEGG